MSSSTLTRFDEVVPVANTTVASSSAPTLPTQTLPPGCLVEEVECPESKHVVDDVAVVVHGSLSASGNHGNAVKIARNDQSLDDMLKIFVDTTASADSAFTQSKPLEAAFQKPRYQILLLVWSCWFIFGEGYLLNFVGLIHHSGVEKSPPHGCMYSKNLQRLYFNEGGSTLDAGSSDNFLRLCKISKFPDYLLQEAGIDCDPAGRPAACCPAGSLPVFSRTECESASKATGLGDGSVRRVYMDAKPYPYVVYRLCNVFIALVKAVGFTSAALLSRYGRPAHGHVAFCWSWIATLPFLCIDFIISSLNGAWLAYMLVYRQSILWCFFFPGRNLVVSPGCSSQWSSCNWGIADRASIPGVLRV